MKNVSFLFFLMSLFLFTSCAKKLTYYSDRLQNEFNWSEAELSKIQFYVSEDIQLYRVKSGGGSEIENGKIKIKDRQVVDEVVIKRGTPGILVFSPNDKRFAVCFDDDTDKYLMFGPSKKNGGRYSLLAKDWGRRDGIITYGGTEYRTKSSSAYASLMVDIKKASNSVRRSNTASGRKVK